MDYEKEMSIDESQIDMECLDQAKLMLKVTRLEAELDKAEDNAKEAKELAFAELDKEIRSDPEKFGVEKVTEASVKSAILSCQKYKDANQAYINAKFEAKCANGAVRACDQRKSMLETLAKLHGQSYFAGPRTPHNLSEVRAERNKQTETNIGNSFRRTK